MLVLEALSERWFGSVVVGAGGLCMTFVRARGPPIVQYPYHVGSCLN